MDMAGAAPFYKVPQRTERPLYGNGPLPKMMRGF